MDSKNFDDVYGDAAQLIETANDIINLDGQDENCDEDSKFFNVQP